MRLFKPMLLLLLTGIAGCATSTPIAVSTPTYHVPPVSAPQRSQESAALAAAEISQATWQKLVTSLPAPKAN